MEAKLKSHLGLQFTDEKGIRHESWQLLDDKGVAQATADFFGKDLVWFRYADSFELQAKEWVVELGARMERS
jgi:hypothetical protein